MAKSADDDRTMTVQTFHGPEDVTVEEVELCDAAIFGETPAELAAWTGIPVARVRKLVKELVRRQLMDCITMETHEGGRKYKVYRRVGPED